MWLWSRLYIRFLSDIINPLTKCLTFHFHPPHFFLFASLLFILPFRFLFLFFLLSPFLPLFFYIYFYIFFFRFRQYLGAETFRLYAKIKILSAYTNFWNPKSQTVFHINYEKNAVSALFYWRKTPKRRAHYFHNII